MSKINEAIDRAIQVNYEIANNKNEWLGGKIQNINQYDVVKILDSLREPEDGLSDEFKKKFEEYSKSAVELTELQKAYDDGYNSGKLDAMKEPE